MCNYVIVGKRERDRSISLRVNKQRQKWGGVERKRQKCNMSQAGRMVEEDNTSSSSKPASVVQDILSDAIEAVKGESSSRIDGSKWYSIAGGNKTNGGSCQSLVSENGGRRSRIPMPRSMSRETSSPPSLSGSSTPAASGQPRMKREGSLGFFQSAVKKVPPKVPPKPTNLAAKRNLKKETSLPPPPLNREQSSDSLRPPSSVSAAKMGLFRCSVATYGFETIFYGHYEQFRRKHRVMCLRLSQQDPLWSA